MSPRRLLPLALAVTLLAGCGRPRSIGTGAENEIEKQRRELQEHDRAEREAADEIARRRQQAAAEEDEAERKELAGAVLATCQAISQVNTEMDREARDPKNNSDYRARQITERHYAALADISLQDCPDDFAAAARDFVFTARGFSEYAYTQSGPEIGFALELIRKGPAAVRLGAKNLKPGPEKLAERYLQMADVALRYGVAIDDQGARMVERPATASTPRPAPPKPGSAVR